MIHDWEFDLLWAEPPPQWMEGIGPLMEYWGNPIFQRRYLLNRVTPAFDPLWALSVGFWLSLAINLFLAFCAGESALGLGVLVTLVIPGSIALAIMSVRMFTSCLLATPLELKRELHSDALGPILTTPISDSRIFFAEVASGIMRGLGAVEEVLAILIGLTGGYLLGMCWQLWPIVHEAGIVAVWLAVFCIMGLIAAIQLLVLTALAAGLYAIVLPVGVAVAATLVHVVICALISPFLFLFPLDAIAEMSGGLTMDPVLVLLGFAFLEIVVLAVATTVTGRLGVRAFATARRPGYYEPEMSTAAGLLRLQRDAGIRFGREV
jgi:hypothetical protein